jgi:hypothetical protein
VVPNNGQQIPETALDFLDAPREGVLRSSTSELGTHEAADLPKPAAKLQAGTAVWASNRSRSE